MGIETYKKTDIKHLDKSQKTKAKREEYKIETRNNMSISKILLLLAPWSRWWKTSVA